MAWEHLSITKPHLVYIILGGFTSLFMLCSSVIKERLYIGEATVATICGIIFGPHAANLINPLEWGNTDLITLEFSRIVLVVQCFAVGVELPKAYMERHWRSVTALLIPVMTFGWLITSLFIWAFMRDQLNWLDSLCVAACVTATDPVLASSVVGKGKFAKRVPKHLRDLLSAESGCNDGMAFPFIYLAVYIIRYRHHPDEVALHWFCYTVLYECIFGAVFGVTVGYIARRLIRYSHEKDLIDRESFLVFYFVLALFCAGSGSLLGMDDLLIGFACGVGFSNDGWFLEKTEEAHVSNVIDLLINLTFFVYFGTIIPWEQFNSDVIGTSPWKLVVIAILVLLFRRIPIMMLMKPLIPDIKTYREALFAGHFGPIGVGAIFVAILARAEMETEETTPLAVLPEPGFPHMNIIELIWPITCFLVICSIIVHGSSIAVFTLGKHINTLTLTLSYTQANEDGPSWMDRLPRIQSRSKSSMSLRRPGEAETDSSWDEKGEKGEYGSEGFLSVPRGFLGRKKDDDAQSRSSSRRPTRRRRSMGPGGPISQSAITPARREHDAADAPSNGREDSDTTALNSDESPEIDKIRSPEQEVYQEGDKMIFEDEEGNVLDVRDIPDKSEAEIQREAKRDGRKLMKEKDVEGGVAQTEHDESADGGHHAAHEIKDAAEHPKKHWRGMLHRRHTGAEGEETHHKKKRGPALAYQFGNTIIVEDEDGEVIKKYDIPPDAARQGEKAPVSDKTRQRLARMGTYLGMSHNEAEAAASQADVAGESSKAAAKPREEKKKKRIQEEQSDDERIRFTVNAGGRRMSKAEFIQQIQQMDPKARTKFVENSDVPEPVKEEARNDAKDHARLQQQQQKAAIESARKDRASDSDEEGEIPFHNMRDTLGGRETAAEARRRQMASTPSASNNNNNNNNNNKGGGGASSSLSPGASPGGASPLSRPSTDGSTSSSHRGGVAGVKAGAAAAGAAAGRTETGEKSRAQPTHLDEGETAAERRRREGALGLGGADDDSTDSESEEEDGKGIRRNMPVEKKAEREKQKAVAAAQAAAVAEVAEVDEEEVAAKEQEQLRLQRQMELELELELEQKLELEREQERERQQEQEQEQEQDSEEPEQQQQQKAPGIRFAEPTRPTLQEDGGEQGAGSGEGDAGESGNGGKGHHKRSSSGLRWFKK
ncbi:na+ h+ antiporter nha1 [Diplodia corticola]|uniref:Na+ h+ antiporter nha1 n=1 Tax=Diplodia corticola TaxID=236234 RepID=A0A1J9QLT1_9PEZI|nr:na+ h+ antiporter nha1 [Diplodia corticola]OJD29416.1 na+ h+ antiporter nha1 [Diplodia corticola]